MPRGRRVLIVSVVILSLPVLVVAALLMLVVWLPALVVLHILVWLVWLPRGTRGVMVYSNSPNWQQDVEETILPAVAGKLAVLNWSERKRWGNSLAAWVFRFANFGGRRNFNPMAIVFRPPRPMKTVRFFYAYRDAKHGNLTDLEAKKKELFELIQ
jgi:hypothetical protein